MSMTGTKVWVGGVWERRFDWGSAHSLTLYADDLVKLLQNTDQNGHVHLQMTKLKNEGKKGQTHCLTIDEFKTTKNGEFKTPCFGGDKPALGEPPEPEHFDRPPMAR